MIFFITILFLSLSLNAYSAPEPDLDPPRKKLILEAINNHFSQFGKKIDQDSIFLKNGQGKIDVDKENKLSYFIFTKNPQGPSSKTILLPMSTSRFAPRYYNTNDWWNANIERINQAKKDGLPTPYQDEEDVQNWLKKEGLNTNMPVFQMNLEGEKIKLTSMEYYHQAHIEQNRGKNVITLYRGQVDSTKNELDFWGRGQRARGAGRYWTKDLTYAWRYARKYYDKESDENYLDLLLKDRAPLYRFDVPLQVFNRLTGINAPSNSLRNQYPNLVLGTELPRSAHISFQEKGVFLDNATNGPYLGDGHHGLEFEVRSTRHGANTLAKYFSRPVTVAELSKERKEKIVLTFDRLIFQNPSQKEVLQQKKKARIKQLNAETDFLTSLKHRHFEDAEDSFFRVFNSKNSLEIMNLLGQDPLKWAEKKLLELEKNLAETQALNYKPKNTPSLIRSQTTYTLPTPSIAGATENLHCPLVLAQQTEPIPQKESEGFLRPNLEDILAQEKRIPGPGEVRMPSPDDLLQGAPLLLEDLPLDTIHKRENIILDISF